MRLLQRCLARGSCHLLSASPRTPLALVSSQPPVTPLLRSFSFFTSSPPFLAPPAPSTAPVTAPSPTPSQSSASAQPLPQSAAARAAASRFYSVYSLPERHPLRSPSPAFDPAVASASRALIDFLTASGPQTRRAIYTHFGQQPGQHSNPPPAAAPAAAATSSSPSSPAGSTSASSASLSSSSSSDAAVVCRVRGQVRSKRHLTRLLQQLVRSGRVTTAPHTLDGRKLGQQFVYAVRDYTQAWNLRQGQVMKGNRTRLKERRLEQRRMQEEKRNSKREAQALREQSKVGV